MIVTAATPESGSALEGTVMTPTRVATKLDPGQIMATSISKLWDTSWFNKFCRTQNERPLNATKKLFILVKKRLKIESRIRDL